MVTGGSDNSRRFFPRRAVVYTAIKLTDIFVISLDASAESRYEPLLKRMENMGVTYNITKIQAIPGTEVTDKPHKLTPNTWGCTLSHIKALETARERQLPCVLIIEDDIDFVENFTEKLDGYMRVLPADWEAVWLGGINGVAMESLTDDYYRVWASWGAFGYIVRQSMYNRWIAGLQQARLACDDFYRQYHRRINCYRPKKDLITHLDGWSDRKEQLWKSSA